MSYVKEDYDKQFETMALIRAYANKLLSATEGDCRPSTAEKLYAEPIDRMVVLARSPQKI